MELFPVKLVGDNLGERHKHLNNLVQDAYLRIHTNKLHFETIRRLPEASAVDRLFKIELANKLRHVDYIMETLKDEDMLYVSTALKCLWLVEDKSHARIINPQYLESTLYPSMLTTASNKMKHWIHLHLKNNFRCKQFYNYYKDKDIDLALKFLPKCPIRFFLSEMEDIPFDKITPHLLKLLCERSASAAKVYFQELKNGGQVNIEFIRNIQFLLKSDPNTYFDIIEKYYLGSFKRLNKTATKHILDHHRGRFTAKPELYVHRILDLPTLAKYLNSNQAMQLITKLAKAKYLGGQCDYWFTYKFCEPLVKRIDTYERSDFCNRIFKEKVFQNHCEEAPYPIPPLAEKRKFPSDTGGPIKLYDHLLNGPKKIPRLIGGGGNMGMILDQLFDQYRFCSFESTFQEIQKRLYRESGYYVREAMFLVLVSKAGRRTDSLEALLRWLVEKYQNEPNMVRAAVIRSLMKRAAAYRLPDDTWSLLLRFGHDLGLDGSSSDCREGFHGVVLRHILQKTDCPPTVWTSFLNNFSPLNEYPLTPDERKTLHSRLPELLINTPDKDTAAIEMSLTTLCDALDAYGLRVDSYSRALDKIFSFVSSNPKAASKLLLRLFADRIACRRFFPFYFSIVQSDASYLNALRHDARFLISSPEFSNLLADYTDHLSHEKFFKKLAVYFSEEGGLMQHFLTSLCRQAAKEPDWRLARPIALLSGAQLPQLEKPMNIDDEQRQQNYDDMMQALNQNAHLRRPRVNPLSDKELNIYAMAVWVHTCSPTTLQLHLKRLLSNGRVARLVLALRAPTQRDLLAVSLPHAALARPIRAILLALRILRKHPHEQTLQQDWAGLKSLLLNVDLKGKKFKVYCAIAKLDSIPKDIQFEYCLTVYEAFRKLDYGPKTGVSHRIALPLLSCILYHWKRVDESLIQNMLKDFLVSGISIETISKMYVDFDYSSNINVPSILFQRLVDPDYYYYIIIHLQVLIKYLYSSESMIIESMRIQKYLKPFLRQMKVASHFHPSVKKHVFDSFMQLLVSMTKNLSNFVQCSGTLKCIREHCDEIFPVHKNSQMYFRIRFTVSYWEASQKASLNPDSESSDCHVARLFGEIVGKDIEETVRNKFDSIKLLYWDALVWFFENSFHRSNRVLFELLNALGQKGPHALWLAAMMYKKCYDTRCESKQDAIFRGELLKIWKLKGGNEVRFFLNCKEFGLLYSSFY